MSGPIAPTELPIGRGLRGRCPACGQGRLFQGFLSLRPACEHCGLDYDFADAGDGPAVFVILIGGAIVVFAALMTEVVYQPPYWLHAVLWLPLILIVTLAPLRLDQGPADRAAIPSQGGGRPPRAPERRVSAPPSSAAA